MHIWFFFILFNNKILYVHTYYKNKEEKKAECVQQIQEDKAHVHIHKERTNRLSDTNEKKNIYK